MTRPAPRCDVPDGGHTGRVRPFVCGPRCARHTPAALTGRAEPPEPRRKDTTP